MSNKINDELLLICGDSAAGKSTGYMNLEKPEGVMYMNCEAGKKLPFKSKFKEFVITDPLFVTAGIDKAETMPDVHTIVIESLNFLMDMYISLYVRPSTNGQKAWGDYQEFYKDLMQQHVAKSTKNILFSAHLESVYNEKEMTTEKKVPVKGALKAAGLEAYFSVIVGAKKIPLDDLEAYVNPMLTITEDDELLGYKHVYQTRLTKETVNERIRAPLGMWERAETFINNDAQLLINRLSEYYN